MHRFIVNLFTRPILGTQHLTVERLERKMQKWLRATIKALCLGIVLIAIGWIVEPRHEESELISELSQKLSPTGPIWRLFDGFMNNTGFCGFCGVVVILGGGWIGFTALALMQKELDRLQLKHPGDSSTVQNEVAVQPEPSAPQATNPPQQPITPPQFTLRETERLLAPLRKIRFSPMWPAGYLICRIWLGRLCIGS